MVTTLYLIRHGATAGSEEKRYKGSIDVPLSAEGEEQARKTGVLLRRLISGDKYSPETGNLSGLAAIYCSPLQRAIATAEIISGSGGLTPTILPALRERHFGTWEGLTFDEVHRRYPGEFAAWMENPLLFSPVGGESTAEATARVQEALDLIVAAHKGKRIALVAHGGVNRILLGLFLGLPLENMFRLEQDFAALNIIELWDDRAIVKAMNLTSWRVM